MIAYALAEIQDSFQISWPFFAAQLVNVVVVLGLFALAARSILIRGKGWEVPVWLILAFFIPVIFPIIALIHFRQSKFPATSEAEQASEHTSNAAAETQ